MKMVIVLKVLTFWLLLVTTFSSLPTGKTACPSPRCRCSRACRYTGGWWHENFLTDSFRLSVSMPSLCSQCFVDEGSLCYKRICSLETWFCISHGIGSGFFSLFSCSRQATEKRQGTTGRPGGSISRRVHLRGNTSSIALRPSSAQTLIVAYAQYAS